jgi:hypothetical protein
VKRGEDGELPDGPFDFFVDDNGPAEAASSMHDTMAHSLGRDEAIDHSGFVSFDEVELEARRPRVDYQHLHGRGFS